MIKDSYQELDVLLSSLGSIRVIPISLEAQLFSTTKFLSSHYACVEDRGVVQAAQSCPFGPTPACSAGGIVRLGPERA